MKVRLIDGHFYDHAQEGEVGVVTFIPSDGSPNLLVDWGRGPVKTHASRLERVDDPA